jgi:hypothetical protein
MNDYGINHCASHIYFHKEERKQMIKKEKRKPLSRRAWIGDKVFAIFFYTQNMDGEQIKKYCKTRRA